MRPYGASTRNQGWCLCHDRWQCKVERKALKRLWRKRARRQSQKMLTL